jgi:hypothetical protein
MRVVAFVVTAVALAGCSDSGLFEGLGERSHEYVQGSTTTTLPAAATTIPNATAGAVPVEDLRWLNEGIDGETTGEVNYVVSSVWARGNAEGRFIQASPAEIAEALPGIEFPSLLPEGSRWVTSQLVYDAASATLDVDIAAAFGVWAVEPYTEDEGRLAVLRVGQDVTGGNPVDDVILSNIDGGVNLTWNDGVYSYELFCRGEISEGQCRQMVETALPLQVVAPGPVAAPD